MLSDSYTLLSPGVALALRRAFRVCRDPPRAYSRFYHRRGPRLGPRNPPSRVSLISRIFSTSPQISWITITPGYLAEALGYARNPPVLPFGLELGNSTILEVISICRSHCFLSLNCVKRIGIGFNWRSIRFMFGSFIGAAGCAEKELGKKSAVFSRALSR